MTTDATQSESAMDVETDMTTPAAGSEVAQLSRRWPMQGAILTDAREQSRPYTGDESAADRAWASRVDSAVQGMDVVDEPGMDEWMTAHAASAEPHQLEAELVAAWETHVRVLQGDDTDEDELVVEQLAITANGETDALTLDQAVEQAINAPVADDSDDEGWSL